MKSFIRIPLVFITLAIGHSQGWALSPNLNEIKPAAQDTNTGAGYYLPQISVGKDKMESPVIRVFQHGGVKYVDAKNTLRRVYLKPNNSKLYIETETSGKTRFLDMKEPLDASIACDMAWLLLERYPKDPETARLFATYFNIDLPAVLGSEPAPSNRTGAGPNHGGNSSATRSGGASENDKLRSMLMQPEEWKTVCAEGSTDCKLVHKSLGEIQATPELVALMDIKSKPAPKTVTATPASTPKESGSGGNQDALVPNPDGVQLSHEEYQAIRETNAARARVGLRALIVSQAAMNAARNWSQYMASQNFFSHSSWGRENIASGHASGVETVNRWLNSPGHYQNIVSGATRIGVGTAYNPNSYYKSYWTQTFH